TARSARSTSTSAPTAWTSPSPRSSRDGRRKKSAKVVKRHQPDAPARAFPSLAGASGWSVRPARPVEDSVMLQVLFRVPILTGWFPDGIPVYGFGMMLFVAFLLCTWLAGRRAEKVGISKEVIHDAAIWVFLGGLIGARVTYLLIGPDPATSLG